MTANDTGHEALTSGAFARRSGLSPKALRLYDLSGLLPPAEVDPFSGYRLYSADQLERARRIALLRQLGMPLSAVAEVLAGSDSLALYLLDRWWAAQEAQRRARLGTLEHLRAQLTRAAGVPRAERPVTLREVPEAKVAAVRLEVALQSLAGVISSESDRIHQHLRDQGAEPGGETWVLYHGQVLPDAEAPIEVCVPFAGTADPAGPISIRIEPAHTEAVSTVTRDDCCFPRILAAYEAVAAWVDRPPGPAPAGPVREVYPATWGEAPGDAPFALVAQPVHVPRPYASRRKGSLG